VFVDAGIWYEASNPKALDHGVSSDAMRAAAEEGLRPVTTNLVLAEAHALLVNRVHRSAALAFLRRVREPRLVLLTSTPELEERALRDWIERYDDQDFSLADAVSFAVMAERGIEEALTLDRHFRVAGFRTRPAR
jgi:predicted nucleic acid-binding protein